MNTLTSEQKRLVVEHLACFKTPSEVVGLLKEEWPDLVVSRQQVAVYDPDTVAGKDLGVELIALFRDTRVAFLSNRERIAITHAVVRDQLRDNLSRLPKVANNPAMLLQLLDQQERVEGGLYRKTEPGIPAAEVAALIDKIASAALPHLPNDEARQQFAEEVERLASADADGGSGKGPG